MRAIRTDEYLYVVNYKPERWPVGNPEYDYRNCDNSPTKSYLTGLKPGDKDYRYNEMAFAKRPGEEFYLIKEEYRKVMDKLRKRMENELKRTGDPRMYGKGDIFDKYPYMGKALDYSKKIK